MELEFRHGTERSEEELSFLRQEGGIMRGFTNTWTSLIVFYPFFHCHFVSSFLSSP